MKRIHSLLAIGCGLLFAASPCFAQMYTAIDLITPDTERCFTLMYAARGINSSGDVVGSCMFGHYPDWAFRAAANSPITMMILGTLAATVRHSA
jgi:hypothetical protein